MRILLPSLLALAACTPSASELAAAADAQAGQRAALDRELTGRVAEPARNCVEQTRLRGSRGYGDTIVYEGRGGERYVTQTSGGCESYSSQQGYLVTSTPSTSLCRGDMARVVDRTTRMPIGACSFGDFVMYRPAHAR